MAGKNNSKNKEGSAIIKGIVSLVVGAALLVGAFFGGAAWEKSKAEPPKEDEKQTEAGGGLVIGDGESNGLMMTTKAIARADFAAYGVSEQSISAQAVTVTFVPSDATDKRVVFALAWENASSTWATGKAVTDYVTINQGENKAPTATLECKQAFGETIILTVKSYVDKSLTSTTNLEYVGRLIDLMDGGSYDVANFAEIANFRDTFLTHYYNGAYTVVSEADLSTLEINFSLTSEAYSWLKEAGYDDGVIQEFTSNYAELSSAESFETYVIKGFGAQLSGAIMAEEAYYVEDSFCVVSYTVDYGYNGVKLGTISNTNDIYISQTLINSLYVPLIAISTPEEIAF